MSVYEFSNYRDYLKTELVQRIESNPKYSLRAMAKNLGIGSSTLSEVLSGRTNLSLLKAKKVAENLKLKVKEISYFCSLVQYDSEKNTEIKEQLIEHLRVLHPQKRKMSDLSVDLFKQMSDWYHSAILELPLIEGFEFNSENVSKALGIPKSQAELAISRMMKLGILEEINSKIVRQDCDYKVQSTVRNSAMRKYYKQMLSKIDSALVEQTPQERLSGYLNLPMSSDALPEVDKAIDRFFADLKAISSKDRKKKENKVYHLSLHFINLTRGEKK